MSTTLGSYLTDTTPVVELTLTTDDGTPDGEVQDLTGCTVAAILVDHEGVERAYAASIVGDATLGRVSFAREQSPAIPAGDHGIRIQVTFSGGGKRSYPGTKTLPTLTIYEKGEPA